MYSCCASGFTRERNTVTIIIALLRRISPRRASATDNFASWQTVPLRPHHGAASFWGRTFHFRGGPLAAGPLPRSPRRHHPDIADENPLIGAVGVDHPNFGGPASVGVEQQLGAVRRPNGVIARCGSWLSGELRLVAAVLVHDPDLAVGVLDPRPVGNPLAVQPRRSVGAAALGRVIIFHRKRQLLLLRSVAVHDPQLAKPFLVARPESDPVALRRPDRGGVAALVRQLPFRAARQVDDKDLPNVLKLPEERQLLAVRRPRGQEAHSDLSSRGSILSQDPDLRSVVDKPHTGDLVSVGRPDRPEVTAGARCELPAVLPVGVHGEDVCVRPRLRSEFAPRSIGKGDQAVTGRRYSVFRAPHRSRIGEPEDCTHQQREYSNKHSLGPSPKRRPTWKPPARGR